MILFLALSGLCGGLLVHYNMDKFDSIEMTLYYKGIQQSPLIYDDFEQQLIHQDGVNY